MANFLEETNCTDGLKKTVRALSARTGPGGVPSAPARVRNVPSPTNATVEAMSGHFLIPGRGKKRPQFPPVPPTAMLSCTPSAEQVGKHGVPWEATVCASRQL